MNYLESLFIDADLSDRLVNLGFEKSKCLAGLNNLGNIIIKTDLSKNGHAINWDKRDNHKPLILWDQAISWFNEKHHIHIQVNCVNWRNGKQFEFYLCKVLTQEDIDKGNHSKYLYLSDLYVTSEEARRDGILKGLEIIKI